MKFPPSDTQITAADRTARSAVLIVLSCLPPRLAGVLRGFVRTVSLPVLSTYKISHGEDMFFIHDTSVRNTKRENITVTLHFGAFL